ncbi:hypothetical protein ACIOD2_00010 [Amycolatopsis sp. NPDC088138]|uniref:hypothetical protein n=1 Tax=Amycolatopsis sp. NPDC088138 TaxID=3363938 RepID=UPI00382C51A5
MHRGTAAAMSSSLRSAGARQASLAEVYLPAGQPERAVIESRRANELVPHGASLRVLGIAHEALGDLPTSASRFEAGIEFFKARGAESDEAELLWHLGRVRRLLGDDNGARKALFAAMIRYRRLGYAEADQVLAEISYVTEVLTQQDA